MKYITITAADTNKQSASFDVITYKNEKFLRLSLYSPVTYLIILVRLKPIYTTDQGYGQYLYQIRLSEDAGCVSHYFEVTDKSISPENDMVRFANKALEAIKEDIWRGASIYQDLQNKFTYSNIKTCSVNEQEIPTDINGKNLTAYCLQDILSVLNTQEKLQKAYRKRLPYIA